MSPIQAMMLFMFSLAIGRTRWLRFAPTMPTINGSPLTTALTDPIARLVLANQYNESSRRLRSFLDTMADGDLEQLATQSKKLTSADIVLLEAWSQRARGLATPYYADALITLASSRMSRAGINVRQQAIASRGNAQFMEMLGSAFFGYFKSNPATALDTALATIPWYDHSKAVVQSLAEVRDNALAGAQG